MPAKYLIRLDDACPSFSYLKWKKFFDLFDKYDIKPIIAVIPHNEDPSLMKENRSDEEFWAMVKKWQKKNYCIAMHGYNHCYINDDSGIFRITKHSEFANTSLKEQESKLRKSQQIFDKNNIKTQVFVAPSHSLDINTIKALKNVTNINFISDGLYINPFRLNSMNFVPCQLWHPKCKKEGIWTICVHPETITDSAFNDIEDFIKRTHKQFINIESITTFKHPNLKDYLNLYKFRLSHNRLLLSIIKCIK